LWQQLGKAFLDTQRQQFFEPRRHCRFDRRRQGFGEALRQELLDRRRQDLGQPRRQGLFDALGQGFGDALFDAQRQGRFDLDRQALGQLAGERFLHAARKQFLHAAFDLVGQGGFKLARQCLGDALGQYFFHAARQFVGKARHDGLFEALRQHFGEPLLDARGQQFLDAQRDLGLDQRGIRRAGRRRQIDDLGQYRQLFGRLARGRTGDKAAVAADQGVGLSEDIVHEITCGSAGGQIARFERVAAVTVEAEALSRRQSIGVIGADDLDQPLEARDLVDALRDLAFRRIDQHARATGHGRTDQARGGGELVARVVVELDARHAALALPSRNWVSSGTGRPVAPFSPPDFQAVPAMSRCAHLYLPVKRARKQAAVMVPAPLLPPMLGMSAKLLLSMSW
jgi:hypothetical protein